jgi:catechol 2,3-dioxygenase-like lactoylglutathione lyase family enzyme
VTARNYYHVGILVADIAAARERFAEVTGLEFTPVQTIRFAHFKDSLGSRPLELTVCYSTLGPPFLELVQSDPAGGVYGGEQGEGLHHIGFHEPNVAARLGLMVTEGLSMEAARFGNKDPARLAAYYTNPAGLHGVRLEVVDERGRAALMDWLGSFGPP